MTLLNPLLSSLLLASLSAAAGCGEVATSEPPPGTTPDAVEPAKLQVAAAISKLPILQGTMATVEVTVTRLEGITGAVEITAVGLPDGVTADPLAIPAGATTGTLTLYASAMAPHSLPTQVAVRGVLGGAAATTDVTVTVYGPPGSLDTSFAGGRMILGPGDGDDYGRAVAVQADGKLVVAGRSAERRGDFALIRVDRDGQLDPTFGDGGRVLTDIEGVNNEIHAIAIQPDGKIVVAGAVSFVGTGDDFALARYLPDGSLDQSFGDRGIVTTPLGTDGDTAYALLIQPDGKIIAGGDSDRGDLSSGLDFALVRYLPNGALDTTFGARGVVRTAIAPNGGRDSIYALALQTVGGEQRILAAGGEGDFSIARYLPDGELDASFNFDSGTLANVFGSVIGAARAITITPSGAIAVAGHVHHDVAVVQLTADGHLEPSFGDGGKVITSVSASNWDEAQAATVEPDGKLVVAGWVYEGQSSSGNFLVLRYLPDGSLDETFGRYGVVITPVAAAGKPDQAHAIALQHDDRVPALRIVAAGHASTTNSDFAITRYWR